MFRSVLIEEFKKVYIRSKLWPLLLLVVLVSVSSIAKSSFPNNFNSRSEDLLYRSIIVNYEGSYSEVKHKAVAHQLESLKEQYERVEKLYFESLAHSFSKEYINLEVEINVMQYIMSQFDFAKENPQNRNIIDPGPWNLLLAEIDFDYLAIIFIIILTALAFQVESSSEMNVIIDSSINGIKYTILSKLLLILSTILVLVLVPELVKLISHFPTSLGAPIASHPRYGTTWLPLSLLQTYMFILLLKITGYSLIAIVVVALSQKFRNFVISTLTPLAVFIGPSLIFFYRSRKLWIPSNLLTPLFLISYETPLDTMFFNYSSQQNMSFIVFSWLLLIVITVLIIRKRKVL